MNRQCEAAKTCANGNSMRAGGPQMWSGWRCAAETHAHLKRVFLFFKKIFRCPLPIVRDFSTKIGPFFQIEGCLHG